MKKLLSLLLIICSIGVAYADDKSTVTSLKYVTDELNTRQDKFGANDGKAMTFTNAAGGNLPRDVKENLGTSTTDSGLPTVSAVNTGLENKQDEIGAANTNTVVTYTGTPGTLGQKGIYQDTGTYAAQQNNLIQASTFNAALRNGLENEFVCADRDPVSNQCWLWTIDNATENTLLPDGYTPLEYIESTGTQYIDTGITGGAGLSIDLVAQGTGDKGIIVSFDQDWSGAYVGDNGSNFRANAVFTEASSLQKTNITTYWETYDSKLKQTTTINGITKTVYTYARTPQKINIFRGTNWSTLDSFWVGKVYSFSIFRNGNLILNLVPVKNSSGVVGMYDTVNNQFLAKQGDGAFVAGPEVSTWNVYIPQNQ